MSEYAVGEYLLPTGTYVLLSQSVMHADPRFYPEADQFDPERWTPEAEAERPKFSYFPFGGGPRVCIGEQFAWMEGVLLLATLGSQWQLRLEPGQIVAPQPIVTLRPRYGMRMLVQKRTEFGYTKP